MSRLPNGGSHELWHSYGSWDLRSNSKWGLMLLSGSSQISSLTRRLELGIWIGCHCSWLRLLEPEEAWFGKLVVVRMLEVVGRSSRSGQAEQAFHIHRCSLESQTHRQVMSTHISFNCLELIKMKSNQLLLSQMTKIWGIFRKNLKWIKNRWTQISK